MGASYQRFPAYLGVHKTGGGSTGWHERWFLDGALASVEADGSGLVLRSGPAEIKNPAHAVLWTREAFDGDLRVAYDFTRLDTNLDHISVCILYLQATGVPPKDGDIHAWRHERVVPAMHFYYNHMQCLHISYACTGGADQRYVRARRYPAHGDFDADTRVQPSYENLDLFNPGETWRFTFTRIGSSLEFVAEREGSRHVFTWDLSGFPPITCGRIGLRQMAGRVSRYAGLTISNR